VVRVMTTVPEYVMRAVAEACERAHRDKAEMRRLERRALVFGACVGVAVLLFGAIAGVTIARAFL
jgi:hypothetical protein